MFLYACHFNEPSVTYRQFTKDDLSHLYYDKDTLTFTGSSIVYNDSVTYLLNDTGTIHVKIETEINSFYSSPFNFSNVEDIGGKSLMRLDIKTGFRYANITISRTIDSWSAEKYFEVGANGINGFEKQYFPKDTVSLDTALVLGKIYQNVYKFYPSVDSKTDIRLIYFAKKYGYIKIVKTDGSKLERIDKGK